MEVDDQADVGEAVMDEAAVMEKLNRCLYPNVYAGLDRLRRGEFKLAHYTTAENGLNIINGKSLWMRSSTVMNDFSEIQHGQTCLAQAMRSPAGDRLKAWINSLFPEQVDPPYYELVARMYDAKMNQVLYRSFILSLSEHPENEDRYGRLSMWRAYGRPRGVALVLNPKVILEQSGYFNAFAAPVAYLDVDQFIGWFETWVTGVEELKDLLKDVEAALVADQIVEVFRFMTLCTKHPAFAEEREWRVCHTKDVDQPPPMEHLFKTVRGLPQPILVVNLENHPEEGVTGLAVKELVHRVILGPMDHPGPVSEAYIDALTKAEAEDPASKVHVTWIPLRHD